MSAPMFRTEEELATQATAGCAPEAALVGARKQASAEEAGERMNPQVRHAQRACEAAKAMHQRELAMPRRRSISQRETDAHVARMIAEINLLHARARIARLEKELSRRGWSEARPRMR